VTRKLLFLAKLAEERNLTYNLSLPKASVVEFDDLETAEHTKLKPLSVMLMVEEKTRRILGVDVARMPAKGKMAKFALKKYGRRPDERPAVRERFLKKVHPLLKAEVVIKSDMNPHYPNDIKDAFPEGTHVVFKGRKSSTTGQGELKKVVFDPIFSINHTCAMFRAKMSRLARKSWNLSKKPENLLAHAILYAAYHNLYVLHHPSRTQS
jgi:hypothetical protein